MALALGYFAAGFILAGFSEVSTMLFGALTAYLITKRFSREKLGLLLGLSLGFIIVITAPGNAVRAASLPPRLDLLTAIREGVHITGLYLISQFLDHLPALLLALAVGYLCPLKVRIRRRLLWFEGLTLITLGIIFFTIFLTYFLTQGIDARHFTFASVVLIGAIGFMGMLCVKPLQS